MFYCAHVYTSLIDPEWTPLIDLFSTSQPAPREGLIKILVPVDQQLPASCVETCRRRNFSHQDLFMQETMEAAWEAATAEAAAANSIDPDLEAVWDVPEDGVETLDGVWRRTAARLEAGETALGVREEAPYELSADNRFSDHMDPFEEGVRLFEEGQIADAILCFEAEIARNPENSQVGYLW